LSYASSYLRERTRPSSLRTLPPSFKGGRLDLS